MWIELRPRMRVSRGISFLVEHEDVPAVVES
jgi:hypothetical protein